jgi:hypothetical protein
MAYGGAAYQVDAADDPGYPNSTPPDPVYPCQTLEAIGSPLDGIATPFMWSRLRGPIGRGLDGIWQSLGLMRRGRPEHWVSIHFGRIAVNAHGWERLRSRVTNRPPDPALVPELEGGLQRVPEQIETLRVRLRRARLAARVERAEYLGERALLRARGQNPRELDASELARGPLDETGWTEVLLPWLLTRLHDERSESAEEQLRIGVLLEQRFGTEFGRCLRERGVLQSPVDAAYLTLEERARAVHDRALGWERIAAERASRIQKFVDLELPSQFWGRPRVTTAKKR